MASCGQGPRSCYLHLCSQRTSLKPACHCSCVCVLSRFSCVWLFATPWTVALLLPLSMGFSRQEYWSGLPCPPPGDLLNPGTEPMSLMSPALADRFFTISATWEAPGYEYHLLKKHWIKTYVHIASNKHLCVSNVGAVLICLFLSHIPLSLSSSLSFFPVLCSFPLPLPLKAPGPQLTISHWCHHPYLV